MIDMDGSEKSLLVVIDTNVWDAHTLLRSHLSASMIFLLERLEGQIVLPEVVKVEVRAHLVEAHSKCAADVRAALGRVQMILGRSPDPDFEGQSAVEQAFDDRIAELGPLIRESDIVERHFQEAGAMVLAGTAPNSAKNQQFKDCLLWRSVVDLLRSNSRVILVTGDGGFYGSKDGTDLHADLGGDVPEGADLTLVRSLPDLVACLQPEAPEIDFGPIERELDEWLTPQLRDLSDRQLDGGRIGDVLSANFEAFVTGKPGEVVVRYTIEHELSVLTDGTPVAGIARSTGEVTATLAAPAVLEFGTDNIEFFVAGERARGGLTVIRPGSAVSGPRVRVHALRVGVTS